MSYNIEYHPLQPFLPDNAKIIMLGTFPPKHDKWSMEFFYPNFQNDMWRIMGLLFFDDKNYFVVKGEKRFCLDKVKGFCSDMGIAIYDSATAVNRLNDNASDKFLEIIERADIKALVDKIKECRAIVATGQKSCETIADILGCDVPKVGEYKNINVGARSMMFFRVPSSSRAYPLAIEKKADVYRKMFEDLEIL
ncbi:MAG: uracil-DNA glycosylase family protein [Rikenellaceae bacterium]